MDLLCALARAVPEPLSRAELMAQLWHEQIVGDDALARCVLKLRRALHDNARNPQYIETLPKRGYRLIMPVNEIVEQGEGDSLVLKPALKPSETAGHHRSRNMPEKY